MAKEATPTKKGAKVGTMRTEAPNIRGTYPLAGERIGPAWRAAWAELTTDTWTDGSSLAARVGPAHGIGAETVVNLLRQARAAGLLEVTQRRGHGRSRDSGHYRVSRTSCT